MAKRVSGGFDKKIFGVPVFPVMRQDSSNINGNHNNEINDNNSHAYNQQYRNSNFGEKKSPESQNNNNYKPQNIFLNNHNSNNNIITTNTSNNNTNQWKLRHIDFLPSSIKSKKDEEFEKFSLLVDRANDWSLINPHVIVFSCETVTWSSVDKPLYSDAGVIIRSMSSDKRTKFSRGLRLWYFVFEEVFIQGSFPRSNSVSGAGANGVVFKLGHVTYTCDVKADASFSSLLKKLNADLARKAIKGKVLRVETLEMMSDLSEPELCVWFEHPDKSKDYTWFLRLLISYSDDAISEEIGVHDFVPVLDHRNPHNAGYETYEDLWRKASKHIFQNPNITFICVQSVFVKVKKDTETSSMTLWDKCTHCQHASSYGGLSNQRTEFLQLLRLTYFKSNPIGPARIALPAGTTGKKLFYKYFSPSLVKRAILSPGASDDQDSLTVECLYEDLKTLEIKINSWLTSSGAKVAGVETVTTRLGSGGQEILSSEATSVYNQRERNLTREPWRITIRLVLEGDFKERPYAWEALGRDVCGGSIRSDF